MSSADVVVVGGGIVGVSVAYELACANSRVILVDSAAPGRASDAGAGIISPQTFSDPDDDWFAFGADAAQYLTTLVSRLADDGADPGAEAWARCGSVVVALAEHEDPWFTEVAARILARFPGVEEITPTDARGMFPPLGPVWRALVNPAAARVDGGRLAAAIRTAATKRGVTVINDQALDFDATGDRVTTVHLDHETVSCDALVLAGGAWSGRWGAKLGMRVPVMPLKGQIVHVTSPDALHRGSGSWPIIEPILNFYLVPWPGGRVACGGTFEADAGFDVRPTAAGLRDLLRECVSIAPGLASATFTEVRVGLRPSSADDRPILGAMPGWSNVHICTGHGANGLLMGPYSAALVAAGVRGTPRAELAPYGVARFA